MCWRSLAAGCRSFVASLYDVGLGTQRLNFLKPLLCGLPTALKGPFGLVESADSYFEFADVFTCLVNIHPHAAPPGCFVVHRLPRLDTQARADCDEAFVDHHDVRPVWPHV